MFTLPERAANFYKEVFGFFCGREEAHETRKRERGRQAKTDDAVIYLRLRLCVENRLDEPCRRVRLGDGCGVEAGLFQDAGG